MNTRSHKPEKKRRKFVIIAKVSSENFVKYRTNKIENTIQFIAKKYNGLRYANIFCNDGANRGALVFTYGIKKGLEPAR